MAKNKLFEASFMSGLFGSGASVPWDGKEFEETVVEGGKAIATGNEGSFTFVEGGKSLASFGGADFNTAPQAARIRAYRKMQYYPEVDECIENIVNDLITSETDRLPIELDFKRIDENVKISDEIKGKMRDAHNKIMSLLDLDKKPAEIMRQFYVDGKKAYQVIISSKQGKGIEKLVPLESSSIYKVKMVSVKNDPTGIEFVDKERNAYFYDSKTFVNAGSRVHTIDINQSKVLELPFESVAYADSEMYTSDGKGMVGFMESAVKPANNLNTVEDSTVIYSITRAVDKRAFYVDVGDLPTKSAEEVLRKTMDKFKTQLNYNQATGAVDNNKTQISMVEDYYLARRNGQNVADIQTLEGGRNIGEINHIQYFREKVYTALKIPRSRAREESSLVNIGGSDLGEVSRSEYKFSNHIKRIRKKFSNILIHCLHIECVETSIFSEVEWKEIEKFVGYEYVVDSFVVEQQENETASTRLSLAQEVEPYVGKLFSLEYVRKRILRMSDEEIAEMQRQIDEETKEGLYDNYGESPLQMMSKEERAEREEFGSNDSDEDDEVF